MIDRTTLLWSSTGIDATRPVIADTSLSLTMALVAEVDPALRGRELGSWFVLPAWFSVPFAILLAGVLCWYFVRLGHPHVPRAIRWVRRIGIVCALAAIGPLLRAVTFVHPHEERVEWATAWSLAILALFAWFMLAILDVILVLRGGLREYSDLRREVFGGHRGSREPKDESREVVRNDARRGGDRAAEDERRA